MKFKLKEWYKNLSNKFKAIFVAFLTYITFSQFIVAYDGAFHLNYIFWMINYGCVLYAIHLYYKIMRDTFIMFNAQVWASTSGFSTVGTCGTSSFSPFPPPSHPILIKGQLKKNQPLDIIYGVDYANVNDCAKITQMSTLYESGLLSRSTMIKALGITDAQNLIDVYDSTKLKYIDYLDIIHPIHKK